MFQFIEGAKEYTECFQSFSKSRYSGLAVGNAKPYGKISVVGAGLSGIEAASEMRESRPELNIRLLDRGGPVLKAFDAKIQAHVADWVVNNDVEAVDNANVVYGEKQSVWNR